MYLYSDCSRRATFFALHLPSLLEYAQVFHLADPLQQSVTGAISRSRPGAASRPTEAHSLLRGLLGHQPRLRIPAYTGHRRQPQRLNKFRMTYLA